MRNVLYVLLSLGLIFSTTGCSSAKDKDDWQQYRAKKGQDELSSETAKQKAETPSK